MGRRSLLLLALLPALAACAVPGTDAAQTDNCVDEFSKGVGMSAMAGDDFDDDQLKKRIRHACEEMVKAGLSDDSSEGELFAFLQGHPDITGEVCEASTDALYANGLDSVVAVFGGYVTEDDIRRLGRDGCVYTFTEGRGTLAGGPDLPAIFRAHPYLAAPFCRAPLMAAYDKERPPQRRKVYEEVVTDACMEGIASGVIDYSSGNVLNPSIDQRAFRQLLRAEWAKR